MFVDLLPLQNGIVKEIPIRENLYFTKEKLSGTELLDLQDVEVEGFLEKNAAEQIECHLLVRGVMVLPCSITLKATKYPFETGIQDTLTNLWEEMGFFEKKVENTIDILPIIWENILMEIPMKVVSEDATLEKKQGDGWQLITEEDTEVIHSAFEKLKDLL